MFMTKRNTWASVSLKTLAIPGIRQTCLSANSSRYTSCLTSKAANPIGKVFFYDDDCCERNGLKTGIFETIFCAVMRILNRL